MEYRVFLVEDEDNLNQVLSSYLLQEGWQVRSFFDGLVAQSAIPERPHLWILDIMLPGVDGYRLIREIKADSPQLQGIFISARDADIDKIVGLEMGSDDYMAKPFLPRELVIRVRRILERVYPQTALGPMDIHYIQVASYRIDEQARLVLDGNEPVELTAKEFDLMLWLIKHQGQSMSREQVLQKVWGEDYFGTDRVVDDLVRRLRKKMPDLRLETIYGYGYRLVRS